MMVEDMDRIKPDQEATTYVSDDLDQVVCGAAGVADALHGGEQVRRGVAQQNTHLVGLTSAEKKVDVELHP